MISNIQKVKKARELRLLGKSLSEITKETGIPRSTLSNWLRDIRLSENQVKNLKLRVGHLIARGRLNASIVHKSNRIFHEREIYDEASKQFAFLIKDQLFVSGLSLYWAKGSVKSNCFQFTSSDKEMIKIMQLWIEKFLKIEKELVKFKSYGSYSRINISRIDVLRRVDAWQKLLIKYYIDVVK